MYLSRLSIDGFKGFHAPFEIEFAAGMNVLVGENGSGKTAVVDAIRMLLQGNDPGRTAFRDTDFYRPFEEGAKPVDRVVISACFSDLTDEEQIAFLPWTNLSAEATLTLHVENKLTPRNYYKRSKWGGASSASIFEWDLMDTINCAYLPPLRDAEARLREGRGSRLAKLLTNITRTEIADADEQGSPHPLEEKISDFNKALEEEQEGPIARANELIRRRLREAVGEMFGQDTAIRFTEAKFNRIVESLRLLFFPKLDSSAPPDAFRGLEENSLGYNNLLYLATVLAELTQPAEGEPEYLRILLIEEPEAHLHPQLQTRLLKFLESQAKMAGLQVIVTTHSPVLASAVAIESVVHMSRSGDGCMAVRLSDCGLSAQSSSFISRWLDATKSTLLFAKGVILVEGIAEALLLPKLAERVIREYNTQQGCTRISESLEDAGVSIINMNGVYFKHFMQLFCDLSGGGARDLPVRCAGITDKDPKKKSRPTRARPARGRNPALRLIQLAESSKWCGLYPCELKTFEYDLAMEGENIGVMLGVFSELCPGMHGVDVSAGADANDPDAGLAKTSLQLLRRIERSTVGKGLFAQALAEKLSSDGTVEFAVPKYIKEAVLWVLGGTDEQA